MKLRKDIPNERRNNILMVLGVLLFLITAAKCTGQTLKLSRVDNYDEYLHVKTKRIYPHEALTFKVPNHVQDTIFLSMLADSVNANMYEVKLYAFFPNTVDVRNSKSVTVTFTDNSTATFKMNLATFQGEYNYMEYALAPDSYKRLKTLKVKNVEFESVYKYKIHDDDLFKAFLNSYVKN